MDNVLSDLTQLQSHVLRFYLDAIGGPADAVQFHRAGWWGELGGRTVPRREVIVAQIGIALSDGTSLQFYGSLGDSMAEASKVVDHEHQFICAFDIEHADIVHLVAAARVHHDVAGVLDADSSFLLDDQHPMRLRGYTNAVVLRGDFQKPFRDKSNATIGGMPMRILNLLPLEPKEWQAKTQGGTNALFRYFQESGRDLLSLREREAPSAVGTDAAGRSPRM
jgi:hypothetical protein